MQVATFPGAGQLIRIETVPDPACAPDGVVVKVLRCGICGSDLSMTSGSPFDFPVGSVLGHEYMGEVMEVGREVSGIAAGDSIAVMPIAGCGHCAACLADWPMACASTRFLSGGFGHYVAVPARNAIRLPRTLSLSDGALVEPVAVALHALRMARLQGGERLLVLGAGSVALAVVYWARRLGAGRIVVASRSAHRAQAAAAYGADAVVSFADADEGAIHRALQGAPDVVAECVGKPGMLALAVNHAGPGATVLSLGMCSCQDHLIPALCAFKDLRLLFPVAYTLGEFTETARAFDGGHVRPDAMVGEIAGLHDLPAKFESLRAGEPSLKVHVDPWKAPSHV